MNAVSFIVADIFSGNSPSLAHCFCQIFCGWMSSFVKRLRLNHVHIMSTSRFCHKCLLRALGNCALVHFQWPQSHIQIPPDSVPCPTSTLKALLSFPPAPVHHPILVYRGCVICWGPNCGYLWYPHFKLLQPPRCRRTFGAKH